MRLFVGNLAYKARESDLKTAFEDYGTINEIHIPRERETKMSKGYAFIDIDFFSPISPETLSGIMIMNRAVRVNLANERNR